MHAFECFGQISTVCIWKYFPSNFVLPDQIVHRNISSDAQRDNKPKLHDFLLYINVFISYSFRVCKNDSQHVVVSWVPPSLFIISSTVAVIGWTIWCGTLFPFSPDYVQLAEPYHVLPLESSADPKHGIWVNIVSFLNTVQTPICKLFQQYCCSFMVHHCGHYIVRLQRISVLLGEKHCGCCGVCTQWLIVIYLQGYLI